MKNMNEIRLMPNQTMISPQFAIHQVVAIISITLFTLLLIFYGHMSLALLLGGFTLLFTLNKACQEQACERHAIKSIARLMSAANLPPDLKVDACRKNRQKRLLITSPTCLAAPFLILDLTEVKILKSRCLQKEIQVLQRQQMQVYLVMNRDDENGANLYQQFLPEVGVYHIFGNLDHCLEHIRGQVTQMNQVAVKHSR